MDLVLYINTCPPGTQVTVEWNKNLPRYVSNGESQVFKAFTYLPKDLPFAYGCLTVSRTSFRPWLGPKNTSAKPSGWMAPANHTEGRPTSRAKFLDEIEKICNDVGKDLPAECIVEDDSLDGRITLSHKGVHFAETLIGFSDGHGLGKDVLATDLTQAIQSTEVVHILIPCNLATHKVITSGGSQTHVQGRWIQWAI